VTGSRGFRFQHPELDSREHPPGLGVDPTGRIALVSGDEAVRQSLLLLMSTVPGERVMRPDYGCHLHRLVFSPNDDTTAGLAIFYVRQAVERWEPRVEVVRLDAQVDPDDPGRLGVTLDYRVVATQREDRLVVPVAVGGDGA
jgi:phage baseplate assembly protein W